MKNKKVIKIKINKNHNCEGWTGLEDIDENYYIAEIEISEIISKILPELEEKYKEYNKNPIRNQHILAFLNWLKDEK